MNSFGISESGTYRKMSKRNVIIVGVISICAAFTVGFLIAWFAKPAEEKEEVPSNPQGPQLPFPDLRKIDCYPESAGGVDVATEALCIARGCIWKATSPPGTPMCIVPQPVNGESTFGYTVNGPPLDLELGKEWRLKPINKHNMYGENLPNVVFKYEQLSDNVLRFKVGCVCENIFISKFINLIRISKQTILYTLYNFHINV
jgi:hypothetical protein